MISLKDIAFNAVRQIKTLINFDLKSAGYRYYQVVFDNDALNLRTADGLQPIKILNSDERNFIVSELKCGARVILFAKAVYGNVYEYSVFKASQWPLKGITVPGSFGSGNQHTLGELYKKYVIETPTRKYVRIARPAFSEQTVFDKKPDNFILLGESYDKVFRLNCVIKKTEEDDDYAEVVSEKPFNNLINEIDDWRIEVVEIPNAYRFIPENELKATIVRNYTDGKYSVYLNVWEEYCGIRRKQLIDTIADCGILKIEKIGKAGTRTYIETKDWGEYTLSNFKDKIKKTRINDCYVITDDCAFEQVESLRQLLVKYKASKDDESMQEILNRLFGLASDAFKKASLDIDETVNCGKLIVENSRDTEGLSEGRYICLSGYKIQHQLGNYMRQFNKIMDARSPMPELADILLAIDENNEINKNYRPERRHTIDINTAISYFPGQVPPKQKQIDALKTVLETPDIAIIWGPPGTGKTTLITAILHAIENQEKPLNGTLLTTFQHDALDNLMEKATVNGLPCLRYGGKDLENVSVLSDSLIDRIEEKAAILAQKYPEYKKAEILENIDTSISSSYTMQLSYNNVLGFIENILKFCSAELFLGDLKDLRDFADKIKQKSALKTDKTLLSAINMLRVEEVSYNDDGADMYNYLEERAKAEDLKILRKSLDEYQSAVKRKDFNCAKEIREQMIVNLCADKRCYLTKGEADNLREILKKIKSCIEDALADRYELEDAVISKYVSTFKNNYAETANVVKKYNKYSGVTHNQLDNKKVQNFLQNRDEFENVIIDEAARSSPMDLFVVMSRASQRIILVGDHCQLPQFVERDKFEKAVKNIRQSISEIKGTDGDVADMSLSLFEKLLCAADKLSVNDGINRVVMLDEQFRMPSVLGGYVSRAFYAGKIKSNPDDDYRHRHGLKKYDGKCVVFKNIPSLSDGDSEQKDLRNSRYRQNEIDWIVKDVCEILGDENSRGLSIGIMSFYRSQCEKIAERLSGSDAGVLQYTDEKAKEYTVCDKYKDRDNTVFVGTVDSFQGRQFDVVYLSVTVSNNKKDVGHLKNVNRLCVGMSRALRLMIVAGDGKMLPYVKEQGGDRLYLEEFKKLCESSPEGEII